MIAPIHVPPGFRTGVFASGLTQPTALAFGGDGRLYVTEDVGRVVSVARGSSHPHVVATGLGVPLGLAFSGRLLYVSTNGRLVRFTLSGDRVTARRTLVSRLPYKEHQQDNVVVARDGSLVIGSGSTCDACAERDPRSATILSVRPDGGGLRIVARGARNPYGLAVQPTTGKIFASVNGRDTLGNDEPAEEIVAVGPGRDFGWPACWPSWLQLRLVGACRGVTPPVAYLQPHSSADGMAFATRRTFRGRYGGDLFVAEWGEYYSHRWGRILVRVHLGYPRPTTFATGFDHPLAVERDPKGGLLVADWGRGVVYRIWRR